MSIIELTSPSGASIHDDKLYIKYRCESGIRIGILNKEECPNWIEFDIDEEQADKIAEKLKLWAEMSRRGEYPEL